MSVPSAEVLEAFGATVSPHPAERGMGRTWIAGDVVLKQVDLEAEHAWVCGVYDAWSCADVAVARPLRADGRWSFAGWGAQALLPGATARAGDDPDWFREVHRVFHRAVAELARPAFLDDREDAWTYGERVAWDGKAPEGARETLALLTRALDLLEPIEVAEQLVHGDLGGNVLRDGDRAAVIDWPPYWRPADWALAVVATDAVCWEGADESLLDDWSTGETWPQLLLRAAIYRLATRGRNESLGKVPVGSDGYVAEKGRMLALIEERLG
ncbi:MAG TPA: TIGR02569 family protein [Nocardioides sp.]|uniref:TIGR02569 family protein n=1 Tax=Nocardioides sp. TaxID=35761 RepID=UPI002F42BC62